jgi:hypothetical protein
MRQFALVRDPVRRPAARQPVLTRHGSWPVPLWPALLLTMLFDSRHPGNEASGRACGGADAQAGSGQLDRVRAQAAGNLFM